jgi:hypothetical protein
MPAVHQWHHQDIAHLKKDYPKKLKEEGVFQPCSTIVSLRKGEPRSIYYRDLYHTYKSGQGEVTVHHGNILTMNNQVVHCGKTYTHVVEGRPMKLRVSCHGHIYSTYVRADMNLLLYDNEYPGFSCTSTLNVILQVLGETAAFWIRHAHMYRDSDPDVSITSFLSSNKIELEEEEQPSSNEASTEDVPQDIQHDLLNRVIGQTFVLLVNGE